MAEPETYPFISVDFSEESFDWLKELFKVLNYITYVFKKLTFSYFFYLFLIFKY